jgi:hypothetical protein
MMKEVAVLGCTWKLLTGHSGTVTVVTPASTKTKCKNGIMKGVYKDNLAITIASGSDGSITNATGSGTINATSTTTKVENQYVLRKGDKNIVPIVMTGTNPSPPPPTLAYNETVEIDDPGQSSVKAN